MSGIRCAQCGMAEVRETMILCSACEVANRAVVWTDLLVAEAKEEGRRSGLEEAAREVEASPLDEIAKMVVAHAIRMRGRS